MDFIINVVSWLMIWGMFCALGFLAGPQIFP